MYKKVLWTLRTNYRKKIQVIKLMFQEVGAEECLFCREDWL